MILHQMEIKEQPEEHKVSFSKLESKLGKIINELPLKERTIT